MRYDSAEFKGFKRMGLNSVNLFRITPEQRVQLVLGTNGSGKSSLLREISPLPADKDAYTKDGSKVTNITHRGNIYVLRSEFNPKPRHSFEKNGIELNEGGTATVQRDLCRQEFGYTSEIHNLVTGTERFHCMTVARRREWFTRLDNSRYDYALQVFARTKEQYSDVRGALRKNKERLVVETAKLITREEEEQLAIDVRNLEKQLDYYQSIRFPQENTQDGMEYLLKEGTKALESLIGEILSNTKRLASLSRYKSADDIDILIANKLSEMAQIGGSLETTYANHKRTSEKIDVLKQTGADGVGNLLKQVDEIRVRQEEMRRMIVLPVDLSNAEEQASALKWVWEDLVSLFTNLPENSDKRFRGETMRLCQDNLGRTKEEAENLKADLYRLNAHKQHADSHRNSGETVCPSCKHRWRLGVTDEDYHQLLGRISHLEALIELKNAEIESVTHTLQTMQEYRTMYGEWMRIYDNFTVLRSFWEYISTENNYVLNAPRMVLSAMERFKQDLSIQLEIEKLDRDARHIGNLIEETASIGDATMSDLQAELATLESEAHRLTTKNKRLKTELEQAQDDKAFWSKMVGLKTKLTSRLQQQGEEVSETLTSLCNDYVHSVISNIRVELGRKSEALSQIVTQRAIVANLNESIATLEVQESTLKLMIKELSPTDGLIAEGLFGFIRSFTGQMNKLIRKIWTYPLEIYPCGMSTERGAELDYKFPLMVQNKENIVDDVEFGSTAMQEIVDICFRLVAMSHLGLGDAPLYLDEFGASMDVAHRAAAAQLVNALIEQGSFSQVFVVSHYESFYGALGNADLCVLCSENISIPVGKPYNQHVVIQ